MRNAVGELVIRQPWIGMTRGFWRDRERYLDTYWRRFPGVWVHGDFAAIDEDGLWYILGRSDDTIKVAGKRLGPAEVEAILNAHPTVIESAAIGVPHPLKDQEVVAFCVLRPGNIPSEALRQTLLELVAQELGKPLRPRACALCRDAAQDAQRQGHASGDPRRLLGFATGRLDQFGRRQDCRRDSSCSLTVPWTHAVRCALSHADVEPARPCHSQPLYSPGNGLVGGRQ